MYKFFFILAISAVFIFPVNAQKTKPASKSKTVVQTKVDLGKLTQNTYINEYFELKIEFPIGWLVGDNALESQLVAIQKANVQTKNSKNQKVVNAAMDRVTPLLGGYKFLPGSNPENSSLRVLVENLSANPTIKTSQNYLEAMINTLSLTKLPPNFTVSGVKSEMIGNKMINYIETKYFNNHRRMYAIAKKGFAVIINIDAYSQSDFDALQKVLAESNLDYKK